MHAASNAVEFLLVDGGILQSRSAAIQIGPKSHANFGSLVFQNISIEQSHRWASPWNQLTPSLQQSHKKASKHRPKFLQAQCLHGMSRVQGS